MATQSKIIQRWADEFARLGHEPAAGIWRCSRCYRTTFDIVRESEICESPSIRHGYLFRGGPHDGQWIKVSSERNAVGDRYQPLVTLLAITEPFPLLVGHLLSEPTMARLVYRLELLNGTTDFWVYRFDSASDW